MPYIKQQRKYWGDTAAESFNDAFSRSLEATMLRKQKRQDIKDQLAVAGFQPVDITKKYSPYAKKVKIDDQEYVSDITSGEQEEKARAALPPLNIYQNEKTGQYEPFEIPEGLEGKYNTKEIKVLPGKDSLSKLLELQSAKGADALKVAEVKGALAEQKYGDLLAEKKKKQEEVSQYARDAANDALATIGEVEKGIGHFGLTGAVPSIPGTERAKWEANLNKLLSGKVINVMTTMKEASKTGATGFGQLSEKELKVLQEASTALKKTLSPKDAQAILDDMKMKLQKIASGGINEGKIKVSNGTETMMIDATDEEEAAADGFRRIE